MCLSAYIYKTEATPGHACNMTQLYLCIDGVATLWCGTFKDACTSGRQPYTWNGGSVIVLFIPTPFIASVIDNQLNSQLFTYSCSKTSRRRASIQGIYNLDNENLRTSTTNHTGSLHSINIFIMTLRRGGW